MAGGPNAAIAPCIGCASSAARTSEGLEDDHYLCGTCGRTFGICFEHMIPDQPMWPITDEKAAEIRAFAQRPVLRLIDETVEPPVAHSFPSDRAQWTIGRHPDCDVQIQSRVLAREHAVLTIDGDGYLLRDLASGVETRVKVGDEIRLGELRFRLG